MRNLLATLWGVLGRQTGFGISLDVAVFVIGALAALGVGRLGRTIRWIPWRPGGLDGGPQPIETDVTILLLAVASVCIFLLLLVLASGLLFSQGWVPVTHAAE